MLVDQWLGIYVYTTHRQIMIILHEYISYKAIMHGCGQNGLIFLYHKIFQIE